MSASATYYFREKTEEEKASKTLPKPAGSEADSLVKEWMYYRALEHGESEFALRNKQVRSVKSSQKNKSAQSFVLSV